MTAGDLVQISYEMIMSHSQDDVIGSGIMIKRLTNPDLPSKWPKILVLWNDGKVEAMHEEDLAVISEEG